MIEGAEIVVLDTLAGKHSHLHKHTVTHKYDSSTHIQTVELEHEYTLPGKRHYHCHRSDKIGGRA